MSTKLLLPSLFKRISLTNFLLLLLVIVVFAGLFKREIYIWRAMNWPEFREIDKKVLYACQKDIRNPEYVNPNALKQLEKECLDRILGSEAKNALELFCLPDNPNTVACRCSNEAKKAMPSTLPQTISISSTCERTEKETWFFAFGRYWFSKEQFIKWIRSDSKKTSWINLKFGK